MTDIIVVGGGGREHTIIKALRRSPEIGMIYALPGNGGIAADAVCVPSVLLLADEPTGALNKAASEEIMEEFVKLNREGTSILIVTHDSRVASRCDRVAYMTDGKISGEFVLGKYEESKKQERESTLNTWLERSGW